MASIINISGYKFVNLNADKLLGLRAYLIDKSSELSLKGTILLSTEGINIFLAGEETNVIAFKTVIREISEFEDLTFKESLSETQPFKKMYVKLKQAIIPFTDPDIKPELSTAPHLSPETFREWLDQHKDVLVLDTRNTYEIVYGTFENAVHLDLRHFKDFAQALEKLPENLKHKPIVTFCTGGIRCEKAAALMQKQGFTEVYQLDGGILNYFEKCGGTHYQGSCFVFDERIALKPDLSAI